MFKARAEGGFTLLEIMVAIVILGMGLLGMLGVIFNSLKLSSSSSYRVVAEQQAYSIAEAVRANTSVLGFSTPGAPTGDAYACFGTTGCSATDYLGSSYQIWTDQLASVLPSGAGVICRDSDPSLSAHAPTTTAAGVTDWKCIANSASPYVVKICWDEARISASKPNLNADQVYYCTWTSI